MMELQALQFASYIRAAAKAHEESFDKEASEKAQAACDERRDREKAEGNEYYYLNVVDHAQFYRMDMRQACESVVPAEFVEPVYLLLQLGWNDIQGWADETEKAVRDIVGINHDDDPNDPGADYAFDITFDPDTVDAQTASVQTFGRNMLHAAFYMGQMFHEKFATDFRIVPKQATEIVMVKTES
jgi:hypothetical protein